MKEIKNITIAFRVTPSQRKLIEAAAKREKLRGSDWVRSVVIAALFNQKGRP